MKSFSDIKRRIQPGTVLECIENTYRPDVNGTRRTVTKAQTNGFFSTLENKAGRFWTEYPKAREVQIVDADTFRFPLKPGTHVELRFVEATP